MLSNDQGMGHKEDGAPEGRRTTRSSTRGSTGSATAAVTPPPAKREKKTPTSGRGKNSLHSSKDFFFLSGPQLLFMKLLF